MAKRRQRPVQNPLRRDLVSSISAPVRRDEAGGGGVAIAEPLPVVVTQDPVPQDKPVEEQATPERKKKRRLPPEKWQHSTRTMKTRFVPSEAEQNAEFAETFGNLVRPRGSDRGKQVVTESHITRALWSLARKGGDHLEELGSKAPKLRRPPHGDNIATAEFEDAIADFLLAAFKKLRRGE